MKIILDTGAVSRYISNQSRFKTLITNAGIDNVFITPVTYIELNNWLAELPANKRRSYKTIIKNFPVVKFDKKVSEKAMNLSDAKLHSKPADTLIAATCAAYKLPLITANEKDFKGIKGVRLIR